jgi:hypothetical protein
LCNDRVKILAVDYVSFGTPKSEAKFSSAPDTAVMVWWQEVMSFPGRTQIRFKRNMFLLHSITEMLACWSGGEEEKVDSVTQ